MTRKWYRVTLATSAANAGHPVVMHCTMLDADRTLCIERGGSWMVNMPRKLLRRMIDKYEEELDPAVLARLRRAYD